MASDEQCMGVVREETFRVTIPEEYYDEMAGNGDHVFTRQQLEHLRDLIDASLQKHE